MHTIHVLISSVDQATAKTIQPISAVVHCPFILWSARSSWSVLKIVAYSQLHLLLHSCLVKTLEPGNTARPRWAHIISNALWTSSLQYFCNIIIIICHFIINPLYLVEPCMLANEVLNLLIHMSWKQVSNRLQLTVDGSSVELVQCLSFLKFWWTILLLGPTISIWCYQCFLRPPPPHALQLGIETWRRTSEGRSDEEESWTTTGKVLNW